MNNHTNGCGTRPVILVHGGAWKIPENIIQQSEEGVKEAAIRGYR